MIKNNPITGKYNVTLDKTNTPVVNTKPPVVNTKLPVVIEKEPVKSCPYDSFYCSYCKQSSSIVPSQSACSNIQFCPSCRQSRFITLVRSQKTLLK